MRHNCENLGKNNNYIKHGIIIIYKIAQLHIDIIEDLLVE